MIAPIFIELFGKFHPSIDIEVVAEAFLQNAILHQANVHQKVEFCRICKGLFSDLVVVGELFEHEVEKVDAGVRLVGQLLLEKFDTLCVQVSLAIHAASGCHVHDELRDPLFAFLE